ncbi:Dnal4 [Symbiodinium microadriaticum]|nr:Dnal4 [Symbiodinium microadriaticum]
MASVTIPEITDHDYRKLISKALTRVCCDLDQLTLAWFLTFSVCCQSVDMSMEMSMESMEIITMAVDKHQATKNYEAAAQLIKTTMDKKFGAAWHCVIGEGFGFEITYQAKNMVYVYYGSIGILAYKC